MTGTGATTACNNNSSSNNHGNYHRRRDGVQPTAAAQRPLRDITLIELNNRALDLLQAGFCRLCIDTFKDALELMKTTTTTAAGAANDDAANRYRNQYASMVERAESRRRTAAAQQQQSSHNQHSPMAAAPHGLLVFSSDHDATEVYNMLATVRTSRVALTMRQNDPHLDFASLKAILVYNYGMAHRCCPLVTNQTTTGNSTNCTSLQNFCLQIFQYAETLTPTYCDNLLFRFILTRNLMMLSCRLGMSLCEHYKETLDPIERAIRGPILPPDHDHGPHEAAAA
jgi:hypothetical protein